VSTPSPCSELNSQTPLAGTAPTSDSWLILSHQGAWGERPVDTLVSGDLTEWARERGAQILLARTPKNVDPYPASTFWFSNSNGELLQGQLNTEGLPDLQHTHASTPLLLICTNGKRDRCCATFGRNLITECKDLLSPELFGHILECSHIGGHRFAPTAIWLPENLVLGRLERDAVASLLMTGDIDSRFVRGSTQLSAAQQVVQVNMWPQQLDFLTGEQLGADFHITALVNGVTKLFTVTTTNSSVVASCGAEPKASMLHQITAGN